MVVAASFFILIENVPHKEYNIVIEYIVVSCRKRRKIMEFSTTTQMAEKWGISRRRVTTLCIEGRIEGAMLVGNTWMVPSDAQKPKDPRRVRKNGQQK